MSKMYQKLEVDEETGDTQNVKESASNKSNINTESGLDLGQSGETFSVKILLKEAHLQLPSLTERTTIGELKAEIEKITNITPKFQRLIFAGKQLKLDDLTLKGCNIVANSSIHLFPIPMKPAVENCTEEGTTAASTTSNTVTTFAIIPRDNNEPFTHSDPEISQHCREVHLWSIILVFLSGLTLWNNITYALAKGQFGESALDASVTIINTLCSAAGLVVGQYGMTAARTVDLTNIKKYLRWLTVLAVACISMRIIWIFDLFDLIAKKKDMDEHLQVLVIALVCVGAWLNCVYNAHLFRRSVQTYSEAMTV